MLIQKYPASVLACLHSLLLLTSSCSAAPQTKPAPQPKIVSAPQKQAPTSRTITFKNNIKPAQLAYHYAPFINPKPSTFTVSINGERIDQGQEKAIPVTNNKIKVQYYFAFGTRRNGTRSTEYTLADKVTRASFTFAWDKAIRISIDGATPCSETEAVVS